MNWRKLLDTDDGPTFAPIHAKRSRRQHHGARRPNEQKRKLDTRSTHLDCVATNGCKASTETIHENTGHD